MTAQPLDSHCTACRRGGRDHQLAVAEADGQKKSTDGVEFERCGRAVELSLLFATRDTARCGGEWKIYVLVMDP